MKALEKTGFKTKNCNMKRNQSLGGSGNWPVNRALSSLLLPAKFIIRICIVGDDMKVPAVSRLEVRSRHMDLDALKEAIETKVYHIPPEFEVPLHEHPTQDEIFYCIKGTGFGVVENEEIELSPGDVFVAPAGKMHSVKNDETMVLAVLLIPVNRIVCHCNQVSYADIRMAMAGGARTVEDIQEITGAGTGCGNCIEDIEKILSVACGCNNVSMEDALNAVKAGADTVEKLEETTGAGNTCGKCKRLLQNIIDTKK